MGEGTCKISKMDIAFKQMENINNFIKACEDYGVAKTDLFQTADLYENTNMWQVILTLYALGRKVRSLISWAQEAGSESSVRVVPARLWTEIKEICLTSPVSYWGNSI